MILPAAMSTRPVIGCRICSSARRTSGRRRTRSDGSPSGSPGGAAGIGVSGGGELSVSNVQIHDCGIGIAGNAAAANLDRVTVTRATGDGLRIFGGHWTVSSLFCDSSEDTALYVANPADVPTSITVRNSTLRGSSFGISVSHPAQLDLGTAADPGGNIIQGTFKSMYLSFPGDVIEPIVLQAVGNTWQPYRQGADPEGHYTTRVVKSPLVTDLRGDNFWLFGLGWQIQL